MDNLGTWSKSDDIICHYTSLESAYAILKSSKFRFSFVENSLDQSERIKAHSYPILFSERIEDSIKMEENPQFVNKLRLILKTYTDTPDCMSFCFKFFNFTESPFCKQKT